MHDSYLHGPMVGQNLNFHFPKGALDSPGSSKYGFPAFYCDCYEDPRALGVTATTAAAAEAEAAATPAEGPLAGAQLAVDPLPFPAEWGSVIWNNFPHFPYPPPEKRNNKK